MAGIVCTGTPCNNGQCVSRMAFCNGQCDCSDCSDERRDNCPFQDFPSDNGGYSSGLGSGAIIGIVVAAICVLLVIIGILIIFLICRVRREALKNLRNRRGRDDPSLMAPGCALPIDIPIEALAREPPPEYTPRATERATNPSSFHPNQFNINVLPPPYYAPEASATVELSYSHEAPPKYQSVANLCPTAGLQSKTVETDSKELSSAECRRQSVDSFVDVPSMSNILLTSSRSSGLGFQSRFNSVERNCVLSSHAYSDSARGESLDLRSDGRTSSVNSSRFSVSGRSRSLSNILSDSIEIPQHGLQKSCTGAQNSRHHLKALPSRSVPSLALDNSLNKPTADVGVTESPPMVVHHNKQKQRRYRKRAGVDEKTEVGETSDKEQLPTLPTHHFSESQNQGSRFQNSKRNISRSLPQLMTLQEEARWEEIGSCDV